MINQLERRLQDAVADKGNPAVMCSSVVIDKDFTLAAEALISQLTAAELAVLNGYRHQQRRLEWLAGRCAAKAAVRKLPFLKEKQCLEILRNPFGAPYVKGCPRIRVSISHSASLAVAVAAPFAVGIDIEQLEPRPDAFVRMFFDEREIAYVKNLSADAKTIFINRGWTYKEAVAKVLGKGGKLNFKKICSLEKMFSAGPHLPLIYTCSGSTAHYAVTLAYQPKDDYNYGRNQF